MMLSTLFLSAFMLLSCSNQEPLLQEEVTAQKESTVIAAKKTEAQKYDYIYGLQIYYSGAEAEIKRLESEKNNLVVKLENGDKKVMEHIENIQIQIKKLHRVMDFLMAVKPPKGLKGPVKPRPCFEEYNCNPKQKLTIKTAIVLGEELTVSNVVIKNEKDQLIDAKFQPIEDQFSQSALQLLANFKGEGTMYTTLKIKAIGEITIPTPVVGL